jgi:hypothetical protein
MEKRGMKKASWIVLCVVGVLFAFFSLLSAANAYWRNWTIGPSSVTKLEAVVPGTEVALRGARATAAGFGVAFGVLFLAVVLGPYRRGDVWAWWALLGSTLSLAFIVLLRVPLLGTTLGIAPAAVPLVLVLLGLGLDLDRVRGSGQ